MAEAWQSLVQQTAWPHSFRTQKGKSSTFWRHCPSALWHRLPRRSPPSLVPSTWRNVSCPPHSGKKRIYSSSRKARRLPGTPTSQAMCSPGRGGRGSRGIPSTSPAVPLQPARCAAQAALSIVNLLLPLAGQHGYSRKAAIPRVQLPLQLRLQF